MQSAPTLRLLLHCSGLAALSALSAACTYSSDYVPPQDGRARVLFESDEAVPSLPPLDPACSSAMLREQGSPRYVVRRGGGGGGVNIYWIPMIRVHTHASHSHARVVSGGVAARHAATPVVRGASGSGSTRLGSGSSGRVSRGSGKASGGGGKSGGGGGSGSSSDGKALAILALVVLAVLPVVTLYLAASSPESPRDAAVAIDEVNVYNDLARTAGSPCAPSMIIEEGAPSPEEPALEAPASEVTP